MNRLVYETRGCVLCEYTVSVVSGPLQRLYLEGLRLVRTVILG